MFDYTTIKTAIKDSGKIIYWYDKNGKLLLTDNKKKVSKNKIKKLNYTGILFRLSISFHRGDIYGQGGQLAVKSVLFEKENNQVKRMASKKNGFIWFEKSWLEKKNWQEKWLDLIVKKLMGKFEFGLGVYKFVNLL